MQTRMLLILRHAKSSWKQPGLADHDRPLNKRGKRDAPRIGRLLRELEETPELILSSTARRTQATARLVADASGYEGEISLEREFYLGGPEDYINRLAQTPDSYQRVMIVGHNPGMEELVGQLLGRYERMPTAALAIIELPIGQWSDLSEEITGKLQALWLPRELPPDY